MKTSLCPLSFIVSYFLFSGPGPVLEDVEKKGRITLGLLSEFLQDRRFPLLIFLLLKHLTIFFYPLYKRRSWLWLIEFYRYTDLLQVL